MGTQSELFYQSEGIVKFLQVWTIIDCPIHEESHQQLPINLFCWIANQDFQLWF
jgi:hypothetical protein